MEIRIFVQHDDAEWCDEDCHTLREMEDRLEEAEGEKAKEKIKEEIDDFKEKIDGEMYDMEYQRENIIERVFAKLYPDAEFEIISHSTGYRVKIEVTFDEEDEEQDYDKQKEIEKTVLAKFNEINEIIDRKEFTGRNYWIVLTDEQNDEIVKIASSQ